MAKYLHFTDRQGARAIQRTGTLWASSFVGGVYAVEEGALFLPSVQKTTLGRAKDRSVCVVFTTDRRPDIYRAEEVIWHADEIPVRVVEILPTEEAVSKYLHTDEDTPDNLREIERALDYMDLTSSPLRKALERAFNLQGEAARQLGAYVHLESVFRDGSYRIGLAVTWPLEASYRIPKGGRLLKGLKSYLEKALGISFSRFEFETSEVLDLSKDETWLNNTNRLYQAHFLVKPDLIRLACIAVMARAPQELGLPGGPCHIIRDIEEENLPEEIKNELIEDLERGKDLSNADADLLYPPKRIPIQSSLFKNIYLTAHAQYRMNLRGVTVREIQAVFDEFIRWYKARMKNPDKLKPDQRKLMTDLAYGESAKFEGHRSGLTIVFSVDQRRREARLVSCWWTGLPNPPKPKPGQCDFIPYLDKERKIDRPAILGSAFMPRPPKHYRISDESIQDVVERYVKYGDEVRGSAPHAFYSVKDLWPLREYTWTRDTARSGHVPIESGGYMDLSGPEKWDWLMADMKRNGWRADQQPLILVVGKEGRVKVAEGNHRLAIARKLGLRKVPVVFEFRRSVDNGVRLVQPEQTEEKPGRDTDSLFKLLTESGE